MNFSLRKLMHTLLLLLAVVTVCGSIADVALADDGAETKASVSEESDPLGDLLFPKERDYNMPPVQPNLQMFLFTLILFVGFIFVMRSQAWGPIISGLDAREARVLKAEADAAAALLEAEKLKADTEAQLADTQEKVKALIAEARSKADAEKLEIVSKAEAEAQKIKADALAAIESAKSEVVEELNRTIDEQVGLATEHVVGRRL